MSIPNLDNTATGFVPFEGLDTVPHTEYPFAICILDSAVHGAHDEFKWETSPRVRSRGWCANMICIETEGHSLSPQARYDTSHDVVTGPRDSHCFPFSNEGSLLGFPSIPDGRSPIPPYLSATSPPKTTCISRTLHCWSQALLRESFRSLPSKAACIAKLSDTA